MSEHDEQAALFVWARTMANTGQLPELANLFAIPNGGERHKAVAAKLAAEGVEPGVPDVFLAWPAGAWHGLFIEMKYGANKPSQAQYQWINRLRDAGYLVRICYSFEDARYTLINYLQWPRGTGSSDSSPAGSPAAIEAKGEGD